MKKPLFTIALLSIVLLSVAGAAMAEDQYEVTVTNILHGTPTSLGGGNTNFGNTTSFGLPSYACKDPMGQPRAGEMLGLWIFATHTADVNLFTVGQPASRGIAMLSQTGRPFFLDKVLSSTPGVGQVFTAPPTQADPTALAFPAGTGPTDFVLCPGKSITVTVSAKGPNRYLSLAAMIFPTNDGFVGLNAVPLPDGNDEATYYSPAYDSGSEENDELCGNIPSLIFAGFPFPARTSNGVGTPCPNGLGADNDVNSTFTDLNAASNNPLRAEGSIHTHPGIRGIGDVDPKVFGWENAVAKITIRKKGGKDK